MVMVGATILFSGGYETRGRNDINLHGWSGGPDFQNNMVVYKNAAFIAMQGHHKGEQHGTATDCWLPAELGAKKDD